MAKGSCITCIQYDKSNFWLSVTSLTLCYSILAIWCFYHTKCNMVSSRIFFVSSWCSWTFFCTFFCLFQVAWIWHQLQGSELLGRSFQASMKNCFKIYRTCLIHLGIWQSIVTSLTAKTYSLPLSPCFLLSKKTLHSFMKVKAVVCHLLPVREN